VPPVDGKDLQLSIDSKVQFFAYQKLRDAVTENKAKAGSVVVLDADRRSAGAGQLPELRPGNRQNLTGAQLRNRAFTDTFEPGSTMKPWWSSAGAGAGRSSRDRDPDRPRHHQISGSTISDDRKRTATLTVSQVIQKSSNVGAVKIAMQMQPREMWEMYTQVGFGQKPQMQFPGAVSGRLRPYKTWKPIEQATMSYGYGLSAACSSWRMPTPCSRTTASSCRSPC
jgi:cell division protein FtsI (penicillin-binding protein 3)